MRFISPLAFCALLLGASSALSFSNLQNAVPNGDRFRCGTCHLGSQGGEGWNAFGLEMLRQGGANPEQNPGNQNQGWSGPIRWQNLCDLDSDGDTFSNGQELGDPSCTWRIGDAFPIVPNITAPHDADSVPGPCPNGVREDDEECDFQDLNDQSCETLGFSGGSLFCTFDCTFSTNRCFTCGDGIIEIGEACDDQNEQAGDGCTDCSVDENFECDFEPSICTSTLPDAGPPDARLPDAGAPDVQNTDALVLADVTPTSDVAVFVDVAPTPDVIAPDVLVSGRDVAAPADVLSVADGGPRAEPEETCSCTSAPKKAPLAGAFFMLSVFGLVFWKRR